jgi:hypothetical protein
MKYTMMCCHLKEAKVKNGQLVNYGDELGIAGNTGDSDGVHIHLEVIEGEHYDRWWILNDIYYERGIKGSREQANYFVDDDFFKAPYKVTVNYDGIIVSTGAKYYDLYKRHHPAIDFINRDGLARHRTFYWNRTFTGRVTRVGYNRWIGNYIVIVYDTLDYKPPNQKEEVKDIENDLSVSGNLYYMKYNHSNLKDLPKTIFYPPTDVVPDKYYRYIKGHPYNVGISLDFQDVNGFEYAGGNGTFFNMITKDLTSILVLKNKIVKNTANHLWGFDCPQSVLCYYRDGTFGIEKIKKAPELFIDNDVNKSSRVWWAIGGIGLISKYGYNPASEGFKRDVNLATGKIDDYSDVTRIANHASIGVDKDGMVYWVRHYMVSLEKCVSHMKELGCVMAIALDGGGSTQMATPKWKMAGSRKVPMSIQFIDLLV